MAKKRKTKINKVYLAVNLVVIAILSASFPAYHTYKTYKIAEYLESKGCVDNTAGVTETGILKPDKAYWCGNVGIMLF